MDHWKELTTISRLIEGFRQRIGADAGLQTVQVLMAIAGKPGMSVGEVSKSLELVQSSTTRNVQILAGGAPGKPGLGMVEIITDAFDSRRKALYLTRRGADVVEKALSTMLNTNVDFSPPIPVNGHVPMRRVG